MRFPDEIKRIRHPCSLFRFLRKLGFFKDIKQPSKPYVPKPYHTPTQIGVKMRLDVKYVSNSIIQVIFFIIFGLTSFTNVH